MFERSRRGEHALLIQPHARGGPDEDALEEFTELARSAGATVATVLGARIDRPNPATLVGSGKLEEMKAAADATGADLVLVNHPLSPVQERNLERALERRVVDRTGLILDIFAQRARSHEGKLQVELAQLKHMATRLVRGWSHLDSQRGGAIGLRGPGETQLETDRRLLAERVKALRRRLEQVQVQRRQSRRARDKGDVPTVALIGYTNAGKSTLFNRLTGAGVPSRGDRRSRHRRHRGSRHRCGWAGLGPWRRGSGLGRRGSLPGEPQRPAFTAPQDIELDRPTPGDLLPQYLDGAKLPPVRPQHDRHLALVDGQVDAVEHLHRAVAGVEARHLEDAHHPTPR